MNVLHPYIDLRLDLNFISVSQLFLCVYGYKTLFNVFVIDDM
jgi:hypothetical protein